MNSATEFDRSYKRVTDAEDLRADGGFGDTRQAHALVRIYLPQLAERIEADRTSRYRDTDVWRALRGKTDDLAARLLWAGITAAVDDVTRGPDDTGNTLQSQAIFIAHNLGCHLQELGPKVGLWGIKMLESLPIFDVDDLLILGADITPFTSDVLWRAAKNNPLLSPRTTPPEPWTQVRKGGLSADHWAAGGSLVRGHRRANEAAVHYAIGRGEMDRVLEAVNVLQPVRFAINKKILNFVKQQRLPHLGKPPPKWRRPLYRQWLKDRAKIVSFNLAMATAEDFAEEPYFCNSSLTMDFRGRQYPSQHFNFAREDHVRALFLFADAEPIGESGIRWLKARVATLADGNAYSGVVKPSELPFDERVLWTETNLPDIRAVAKAVDRGDSPETVAYALQTIGGDDATLSYERAGVRLVSWAYDEGKKPKSIDSPFQFAAACFELAQALDEGPSFKTRLPLMFDGCNNGIQHLCLMTRDEVGGRYVNLVPGHPPDDFYKRVAVRAYEIAPDLMESPFDRGIVKQPAVSYFYGSGVGGFIRNKRNGRPYGPARPVGMTGQIINYLKKTKKLKGEKPFKGTVKLARAIYGSIEDMLPKAKAVRDFLQELAGICAQHGKSLRWVTPLGLPVINEYHEPEVITFPTWLGLTKGGHHRRKRTNFTIGDKPGIDADGAIDAAAANFVHSVDAAHLQLVALASAKECIPIAAIHDCFGTHAAHAERLNEIILEQLVHLHKRYNWLNEVREKARRDLPQGVELPPLPELGALDIDAVVKCTNAFK